MENLRRRRFLLGNPLALRIGLTTFLAAGGIRAGRGASDADCDASCDPIRGDFRPSSRDRGTTTTSSSESVCQS